MKHNVGKIIGLLEEIIENGQVKKEEEHIVEFCIGIIATNRESRNGK